MSVTNPRSSIDGGWGWVVVFAGMIVYLIVFGSMRCQSVLFLHIVDEFDSDFSAVAWVSSIAVAGFSFAGVLSAPLITKIGHRWTVIVGGVIAALGSLLASFVPNLALLYLTAGVLTGVGMGIAFVPSPVLIGHYFQKRRSIAINIAGVGASLGTLAVCPLNEVITEAYTLRGYFLLFAGVLLNICVAGALMRPPPPQPKAADPVVEDSNAIQLDERAPLEEEIILESFDNEALTKPSETEVNIEKKANCCTRLRKSALLHNRSYVMYCISQVIFLSGFLCNQLYIVPYAELEAGVPKIQASLLMSIGAFVEIGSRLIFGFLGDVKRIDRIWLFAGTLFVMSFFAAILPFMKSFATLATVAALTGLFQGGFSGMSVVILADIVGLKLYAPALGISTLLNGFGTLLTPPAVGLAVDATGRPSTALYISAGILFLGAILTAMIKVSMIFEKRERKRGLVK